MKIISIVSYKELNQSLEYIKLSDKFADGFELRLDYLSNITLNKAKLDEINNFISKIICLYNKNIIITLRDFHQGGSYQGSLENKLKIFDNIALNNKDYNKLYFDFEYYIDDKILEKFRIDYSEINIIRSYHDFNNTPDILSLEKILAKLVCSKIKRNIFYKIVTTAKSSLDSVKLLNFLKNTKTKYPDLNVIAHCMGECGAFSRIINGIYGSKFSYGFLDSVLDSNNNINKKLYCVPIQDLFSIYRVNNLNLNTKIYALLGNPVFHSQGHIFHNQAFLKLKENAVYVKIKLNQAEIDEFFYTIKNLNFSGFSITMPLKEQIYKYTKVNDTSELIKAINTIKIIKNNNKYILESYNTDGAGAYKALCDYNNIKDFNKHFSNKNILILGAGGASKSVILEFLNRSNNINITILNRTITNAYNIESIFNNLLNKSMSNINVYSFSNFITNYFFNNNLDKYDYIINTISGDILKNNTEFKILLENISNILHENSIVMDINYYNNILDVIPKNIRALHGKLMFEYQAKLQLTYWFNKSYI
tara:strand:- start:5606 stop:7213 length:1608 start_codon:yes stop_codon:yes gene_type:complete